MAATLVRILMLLLSVAVDQSAPVEIPEDSAATRLDGAAGHMMVSIEGLDVTTGVLLDTLEITLDGAGVPIAGLDLRFGVKGDLVEIVEVLPGEILDSCRWEFFDARPVEGPLIGESRLHLWRVVALSEMIPDSVRPRCYGLGRRASLVRAVVQSPLGHVVPDTVIPVAFYWESCTDNTLSGVTGNDLYMLSAVSETGPARLVGLPYDHFPYSAPEDCIKPGKPNQPIQQILFLYRPIIFEIGPGVIPPDTVD